VFRRSIQRLSVRLVRIKKSILSEVITVGTPSMLRSLLAVVAGILLNNLAGEISDSVLAGIGVTTKIMMFPFSIILGFGTGFQPVAGFNWGAKRYDRVEESFRYSSRMAVIGAAVMAAALALGADWVITVFGESDPEMQRIGGLAIRLQCLALPIHAWVAVVNMYCNGLGHAKKAFVLATSRQGSCFLPILYPLTWLFGEYGIASVQAVADVITVVLAIPILRKVKAEVKAAKEKSE
jgi:Na+-driven multidrug efflux pump